MRLGRQLRCDSGTRPGYVSRWRMPLMAKLCGWNKSSAVFIFCVATAILSSARTFTSLLSFDGTNGNEPGPISLVQGTDGNFYGTTTRGGTNLRGTVFRVTPSGTLTTLYNFCSEA